MIARALALTAAATILIGGALIAVWFSTVRGLEAMGPTSMLGEDYEAWAAEQALTSMLSQLGILLLPAGLICGVGAVVIMAVRARRLDRTAA